MSEKLPSCVNIFFFTLKNINLYKTYKIQKHRQCEAKFKEVKKFKMDLVVVALFAVALIWLVRKFVNKDNTTDDIDGPKPWPIIGNILPLMIYNQGGVGYIEKLCKQFHNEK